MDPLSIIASTIAITQALGFGIKTLQSLANSNVEFGDMLNELSSLREWLSQLEFLDLSDVQSVSLDAIRRLETVRSSLQLLAGDLDEVINGFHCGRTDSSTTTGDKTDVKTKISKLAWQRNRSTVFRLRERAKQCREELMAGLGLIGLSEQLYSSRFISKIHSAVESTARLQEHQLVHIHDATRSNHSLLSTMTTRLETIERQLTLKAPGLPSNPKARKATKRSSTKQMVSRSFQTSESTPLPQACTRDCKCQCHRSSTVVTPEWVRSAVGSLALQYSGAISLNLKACSVATCHSGGKRSAKANYMFPPWLLRRGLFVSMAWDSLTNRGASLHLMVPTLMSRDFYSAGLVRAIRIEDTKWIREKVMESKISPTTVDGTGLGILSMALQSGSFKVARELLSLGFNPLFMDSNGVSAILSAKEYLLQSSTAGYNDPAPVQLTDHYMDTLKYIARQDEDLIHASNPLRDCILGLNDLSIEDALNLDESSHINALDSMGFAPLHLAVIRGDVEKTKVLLLHHALVDIQIGRRTPRTSLDLAASAGRLAVMSVLLSHGANVNGGTPSGFSPLHGAAHNAPNPAEAMELLLEMGADPNLADVGGLTPLHFLARRHPYYSGKDCGSRAASLLVQRGLDLNHQDSGGLTPLIYSVIYGNLDILRYLCQAGARLDLTCRRGFGVFHVLGTWVHPEQVACLSSLQVRGVDPDAPTAKGSTPIRQMESQARCPIVPETRTHRDAFAFCALIVDIRWRNWDSGQFIHRRDDFFQEGRRQRVYRWLGWKWQQLRDHPYLAEEKWGGIEGDGFEPLDKCEDVESVESFCIDGLFEAKGDGEGSCPVSHVLEGEKEGYASEEDEFFDVEG